jgi:hypothetical protein
VKIGVFALRAGKQVCQDDVFFYDEMISLKEGTP